ncbi:MAG: imidazole glycerol phosphate synthase subunit HisH [Leptolyngbyaceae cyanobacterium]
MIRIAVIDYDMGNLHSACKGLEKAGAETIVSDRVEDWKTADGIVLPGVGAFDPAMQHLKTKNLVSPIHEIVATGKPFLGICVGLQVLFDGSEEGQESGLGVIPGMVRRFKPEPGITIPHMGWNQLTLTQPDMPLWQHIHTGDWVYFVHSYYPDPLDSTMTTATVTHGQQTVSAAVAHKNVMAVQFHPEKSSTIGMQMLSNFVAVIQQEATVLSR